jgi:hypothetical protein
MSEPTALSESPFVDLRSFEIPTESTASRFAVSSPFVQALAFEEPESGGDTYGPARRILLAELYDEELDDAVYELIGEASSMVQNGVGSRLEASSLRRHFDPLAAEIEGFIQRAADEFGTRDAATISEEEIDDVIGRISAERQLGPGFDQFFGRIKNAVKRAAKGAVSLAKKGINVAMKLGLGPILAKLKKFVRPFIDRILKTAIDRLPVALRPAATQLAGKLKGAVGMELDISAGGDEPAVDVSAIQSEFNEQVASALLGEEGLEPDQEATGWRETGESPEPGIRDLDAARERFVAELERLDDGEDPGPAVEQFIPALLPVVKLGITLAGRKRVVSLLSGMVSQLISRFVGKSSSGALSTALVDAGMKLLGLEVSDADQRHTANAALAATVEETVRTVAALPDAVLDNETLLEGSILRAFEAAAAANLPPLLSEAAYRRRPELVETDSLRGTWIPYPVRGPKRYKKFSRVIRTRITPRVAMAVTTFGEAPLSQYLQEQLGLEPGEDVEAELHLYETQPGTLLGEVARLEALGNGTGDPVEFHPLTQEAAALLVREPGLARSATAAGFSAPKALKVGQRFYSIKLPGQRVAAASGPGAKRARKRRTSVYTVLDFPGDRIRLYLFLSERRAQEMATAVRKQGHAGTVATGLKGLLDRGVASAVGGNISGRIKIIHEALMLDEARGAGFGKVPKAAVQQFAARIGEWTLNALTNYLSTQSARFLAATEDAKEGVTVVVTLANPPGMAAMRKGLGGSSSNGARAPAGAPASVEVDVVPGFTNG